MGPVKQDIVGEIEDRADPLSARGADLTPRVELTEAVGGNRLLDQGTAAVVRGQDHESEAIEFVTENGFSIVRPWESGRSPKPVNGKCRFGVSDGFIEREVTVEISPRVVTEMSLRTRGRIPSSDSFWICCAERHLVNYVSAHADFPEDDELIVGELDREDVLLAIRWNRSDEQ